MMVMNVGTFGAQGGELVPRLSNGHSPECKKRMLQ